MDETTNMKLKKPVENEYISIEIINENMDIIDTGMKEISDSVDAPVFDDSGSVVGITNKTTLLASFVSKMPLVKFLRNVKAGFKLVSFVGDIVNNCVTDNANLPLSAAQGKKLMDLYTVLNTKIINLNVRHNATSDRIQVLRNGDWIDALLTGYIWLFKETVGLQNGASANPISSIFTNTFDNDAIYAPLCKFKNETSIFISKYGFEVAGIVGKRIIIEWSVTNAEAFSKIYVAIARNDGVNNNTNFYNSTEPITANTRYMIEIDLSPIMGFSSTYPNMQIQYENSRAVSGTFKVHNIYLVR